MRRRGYSRHARTGLAAVLLCLGCAGSAHAYETRVPQGYFGVSAPEFTSLARDADPRLATYADGVRDADLDFVRATVDWRQVEPAPAVGGIHLYNWSSTDRLVRTLAARGLELVPNLSGTPTWARALDAPTCGTGSAISELQAPAFGDFAAAVVRRYGRNGSFWASSPDVPKLPVRRVEVWNEPNWTGSWCPAPQPERFATTMFEAARGIEAADPQTEVVLGGLVLTKEDLYFSTGAMRGMETGKFLARMVAARPQIASLVDEVAVHLYDADPDINISLLGWTRARLNAAGLGEAGLFVSEFGWHTAGDGEALSESARAEAYSALIGQLARTDCDVRGLAAHNWASEETDPADPEDWFGLASPLTGSLHPAGQAYAAAVDLFEGRGPTPAPRETIGVCGGPAPDQDSDGTPDEDDDYPLDPSRDSGSGEQPPIEPPGEEPVRAPRADSRFYSVTSAYMPADPEQRKLHYDSMKDVGITNVRQTLEWDHLEPLDGVPAAGRFAWTDTDRRIVAYAKRGIATSLAPFRAPDWLSRTPATADQRLAGFLAAVAERYGANGTLWSENRHLDSSLAPRDYEIWTDASLDTSAWDGSASPAEYAATYVAGLNALKAVDPGARAIASLSEGGDGSDTATFLREMVAAKPQLEGGIDGLYVMAFGARSTAALESVVARVRGALDETGNSEARLRIGFGAPTDGPGSITESERAAFVAAAASRLPRLDCGVDEAVLFAWSSAQSNGAEAWDWFGVADIAGGGPFASATAFAEAARSATGYGETSPERATLHPCMREPLDRDGDGAPDPADPAPLDPALSEPTAQAPGAPQLTTKPASFSQSSSAAFAYSTVGATAYHCRVDDGGWEPCDATRQVSGLADGPHSFSVRAVDSLGLIGLPTRHDWSIDTRRPETTVTSGPSGLTRTDAVSFTLASDEPGARFLCRLDAQAWNWCAAETGYGNLAEGGHTFVAVAVDRAGNADSSQASRFFEVRVVPGNPTIDASGLDTQTPIFTFSAAHADWFECRFDQSSFEPCSGAGEHTPARPLVGGAHRFEVRGRGPTGKVGPVAGWSFMVHDREPPDTTIVSGPPAHHAGEVAEFELASDEDAVSFLCQLDDGPWAPCQQTTTLEDLEEGPHRFRAVAVDPGRNTDASPAEHSFTMDRSAPSLSVERTTWKGRDRTPTIRFQAEDSLGSVTTSCRLGNAGWASCDSPFTTRRLGPGRHSLSIQASDEAGNQSTARVRLIVERKRRG